MKRNSDRAHGGVFMAANSGASKERSTIAFPYDDLDAATSIAEAIYEISGLGACEADQIAGKIDMSPKSSGFRVRLASARTFGLTESDAGDYKLTELGQRIVDSDKAPTARVDAFLAVPLYRRIFETYKGAQLPGNSALEKQVVDFGVSSKQANRARQVFARSAQQAGFFELGGSNRLVKPAVANRPDESGNGGGPESPPPPPTRPKLDPFVQGLIDKLPASGTSWGTADRVKWLQAAAHIFDLMYKDGGEITVEATESMPLSPIRPMANRTIE